MNEEQIKLTLANKIKEAMQKKNLNNNQLSTLINVDKSTVGRWLSGQILLKADVVPSLCTVLELTPNELFGFVDKHTLTPEQYRLLVAYEKSDKKDSIDILLGIDKESK